MYSQHSTNILSGYYSAQNKLLSLIADFCSISEDEGNLDLRIIRLVSSLKHQRPTIKEGYVTAILTARSETKFLSHVALVFYVLT